MCVRLTDEKSQKRIDHFWCWSCVYKYPCFSWPPAKPPSWPSILLFKFATSGNNHGNGPELEGLDCHGDMGLLGLATLPGYSACVAGDIVAQSAFCAPCQKTFDWNETLGLDAETETDLCLCSDGQDMVPTPIGQRCSFWSPSSGAKFWIDFDQRNLLGLLSFEEQRLPVPLVKQLTVSLGRRRERGKKHCCLITRW